MISSVAVRVFLSFLVFGFAIDAGASTAPFRSKEKFSYESKEENKNAQLFETKDFLGTVIRAKSDQEENQLLKLYNISVRPQKIEKSFCEKVAKQMLEVDGKTRKIQSFEKFEDPYKTSCDVTISDEEEGFRERHLIIFVIEKRTYGLRAIFPNGKNVDALKELHAFVKSLY